MSSLALSLYKGWAFLKKDWLQEVSYRISFVLSVFGALFGIVTFYFLGEMIGPNTVEVLEPYGGDYFAFALIGIAFHSYLQTALNTFSRKIRESQMVGTLEMLLVTPTSVSEIILYSSTFSFVWTSLRVVIFLALGTLFGLDIYVSMLPSALLILLLTVIAFASLGLISASFILVFKRGDPIIWIFGGTSALLGGLYYPVSVLPDWLQIGSKMLPITYALEAMRKTLLVGVPLSELKVELLSLSAFALIGVPVGSPWG